MAVGEILAGKAFVEVGQRDKLNLKKLKAKLQKFGSQVGAIGKKLTLASTSILAPLVAATKLFASVGDSLDKLSNRTGFSVEALSELGFAAGQSGSSLESLGAALFRMRRRVANAASGTGPAVRALKELRLEALALKQLSPEDIFLKIVDAMNALGNESRAAQLGFEIFGDNLKDLFPLLKLGSEGIADLREEARRLGLTVSKEAAESAKELTDKMTILIKVLKNTAFQIGSALSQDIIDLAKQVTDVAIKTSNWIKENQDLISTFASIAFKIGKVGLAFIAFNKIIKTTLAIQAAIAIIGGGPIGIGLVVAGLSVAAAIAFSGEIEAALRQLTGKNLPTAAGIAADRQLRESAEQAKEIIEQTKLAEKLLAAERLTAREVRAMKEAFKRRGEQEARASRIPTGPTPQDLANARRAAELNLPSSFRPGDFGDRRGGFLVQELLGAALVGIISRGTFSGVGARLLGRGPSTETRQLDELEEINANLVKLIAKEGPAFA